jgi:hypothetical protein
VDRREKIQLTKEDPEIHGLDLWKSVFWYSDALERLGLPAGLGFETK